MKKAIHPQDCRCCRLYGPIPAQEIDAAEFQKNIDQALAKLTPEEKRKLQEAVEASAGLVK